MTGRRTNLALLVLLPAAVATGVAAFAIGTGWGRWATAAHAVTGIAIIVLAPWKSLSVRRGLRAQRRGRPAAIAFAALVATTLVSGLLHSVGVRLPGPLTAMQVHVGSAVAAVPLLAFHLARRPQLPRQADLSRRNLLRAGGVTAAAAAVFVVSEGTLDALGLKGGDRRFTGSHERASFAGNGMPVTQWFDDSVQHIAAADWSLTVAVGDQVRRWSLTELEQFADSTTATLDCTGGWHSTQEWQGARMARLLPAGTEGRSLVAVSASGYQRRFPLDAELIVATHVGGEPLSAGHGAPARLVAPGRRGFWWVKWLEKIVVDDRTWWLQLPFPIT